MLVVDDYTKQKLIKKPIAPELTVSEAAAATGWSDYMANLETIKSKLLRIIITQYCHNDLLDLGKLKVNDSREIPSEVFIKRKQ